ncbi:MAG: SDR family NAD(P)-dependent oxidoreductase [Aquificales bacterium]|nr:SDR family NAD(P)-dependent oxidoreductase [Aquificales bacterium]
MKAFVTGGSGFIGQQVVKKLRERDYEVYALARSEQSTAVLQELGCTVVPGDITDMASMREGMAGSDIVFHIAAWYKLGNVDWMKAEAINVGGTRKVLRLAHELGIPKIIYTSTIAVFGNTHGQLVDENYYKGGPFLTEYDRTKWLAHYKVAIPLIEKGTPITIVLPGAVYGPGDTSNVAGLMRQFYRGLPVLSGPEMTLTYAHVADIAEGHILAAEKGKPGESYILAGPAIPLGEMIDFWGHLTGKSTPLLRIPASFVKPFAPLVGVLSKTLSLPDVYSEDSVNILDTTYIARADKARAELGWQTRPLQTGMLETFEWIKETEPMQDTQINREKQLAGLAILAAFSLLIFWLLGRRKK